MSSDSKREQHQQQEDESARIAAAAAAAVAAVSAVAGKDNKDNGHHGKVRIVKHQVTAADGPKIAEVQKVYGAIDHANIDEIICEYLQHVFSHSAHAGKLLEEKLAEVEKFVAAEIQAVQEANGNSESSRTLSDVKLSFRIKFLHDLQQGKTDFSFGKIVSGSCSFF